MLSSRSAQDINYKPVKFNRIFIQKYTPDNLKWIKMEAEFLTHRDLRLIAENIFENFNHLFP
jgi:hypothetical protein